MPFRNEKSMTIRLQTYPNITFTSNKKNENYIVMNLTKKNLETHVNDKDRYIKRQ